MARRRLSPEPFEVGIGALDVHGRGTAVHEDRPVSVWDALPGERVLARHRFGRRVRGQAETLEVLEVSPDRASPVCPHFGTCSACTLQHMRPEAQLAFKQSRLSTLLRERGGVEPQAVLPPLVAERWGYRRKARLSVRFVKGKGRVLLGFRERDARFVTDMTECHTLYPPIADRLAALAACLDGLEARTTVPQLEICCGDDACALVLRHLEPLSDHDRERLGRLEADTGLRVYLQPGGPQTVAPLNPGPSQLVYALDGGVEFRFEPLDFVQVNGGLNRRMVRQALDLLDPAPEHRVLDLFCGLGNFSLPLARRAREVLGLEGDEGLVERARENARRNGIANADFRVTDLYAEQGVEDWPEGSFDRVLLDPPRSGAAPLLPMIGATGARRIVYVSCNPETLAEDAGALVREHGFRLAAAGIMDMFPQTLHLESMALFERD